MNSLLAAFESEGMQRLLETLLHGLWQGVFIAALLAWILRRVSARAAQLRYAAAALALGVLVVAGLITWSVLSVEHERFEDSLAAASVAVPSTGTDGTASRVQPYDASPRVEAAASVAPSGLRWRGWLGLLWCVGSFFMLIRAASSLWGAHRLRLESEPLREPTLQDLVHELRESLGTASRLSARVSSRIVVPAVVGIVWPVLLLPVGMVSTLSTEQWRMILAHELAHVRRYDYLVNVIQLFVEALLFFNPAVWWIGRQLRLEREACCDAEAVRVSGEAPEYARTLADVARALQGVEASFAPSTALVGDAPGTLMGRIVRVLHPGHRPSLRIPWWSATLLLAVSAAALFVLQICTTGVVRATAEWLSPSERIEKISELVGSHGPSRDDFEYETLPKVSVRGTVVPPGEEILPSGYRYVYARVERPSATISHSLDVRGRTFEGKVTPGTISLSVAMPGYAPVFLGPFQKEPGEALEGLVVRLVPGFTARLRAIDDGGAPLSGVRCTVAFQGAGVSASGGEWITDTNGEIVLEHATGTAECHVALRAPGHQYDEAVLRLSPERTETLRLRAARPVAVRVVTARGDPIENAVVYLAARSGFRSFGGDPRTEWGQKSCLSWKTDADGSCTLDSLRDDSSYSLLVEAPGRACQVVEGVRAGQGVQAVLGSPIVVECRIVGSLEKLDRWRGEPVVTYFNPLRLGDTSHSSTLRAKVEIEGDEGVARIENVLPGRVSLRAAGKSIVVDASEPKVYRVAVDPAAPDDVEPSEPQGARRRVVVRIHAPEGSPPPDGRLRVDYVKPGAPSYTLFWLPIEDGRVEIEVPLPDGLPGTFRYGPIEANGYWVDDQSGIQIPHGEGAHVLDVLALPAGAIYGRVVDADGRPLERFQVTLITVDRPPTPDNAWPDSYGSERGEPQDGKFVLSSVPLGGTYCVSAMDARPEASGRALSLPLTLDEATPTREVELRIPEGIDVPIQVLCDDGTPVAGAHVSLGYHSPYSHSFSGSDRVADRDGRIVLRGVNPDLPGTHRVRVKPIGSYCGTVAPVAVNGELHIMTLMTGLTLRGVVVDEARGKPLPRVWLGLRPRYGQDIYPEEIEGFTDESGRFELRGLESARYSIKVRGCHPYGTTVRVDEAGRKGYTTPENGNSEIDLSAVDLDEEYTVRVFRDEDL